MSVCRCMKKDARHDKVGCITHLRCYQLVILGIIISFEHVYLVWWVLIGVDTSADADMRPWSLWFCRQALQLHIIHEFTIRIFTTYMTLQNRMSDTTVVYTVQIVFTTANGIFLDFRKKNFKMWYKIRKKWYRLFVCSIKFFGLRSMVDKYLGGLTFNLKQLWSSVSNVKK